MSSLKPFFSRFKLLPELEEGNSDLADINRTGSKRAVMNPVKIITMGRKQRLHRVNSRHREQIVANSDEQINLILSKRTIGRDRHE